MAKSFTFDQVSGILRSPREVEELLTALHSRGLDEEDISVVMSEKTHNEFFAIKDETKAPEGATIGGLSGGLLGIIIGGLTVAGTVLLPGVGLLVAGPLIGALTAGAIGTAAGSLVGGLIGAGIPEHEAKFFEDSLKESGNVLVVAHVPHEEVPEVKSLFQRSGATAVKAHHGR